MTERLFAWKDDVDAAAAIAAQAAAEAAQAAAEAAAAAVTPEGLQDTIGAMVSGNTETRITVTYQDSDGTLDFVVDADLANYSNTNSQFVTQADTDALYVALGDEFTQADAEALFQPLDADLTAIAALTTSAAGRNLLTLGDPQDDRIVFWDESASSNRYAQLSMIVEETEPAAGDFLLAYTNDDRLVRINWSEIPGVGTAMGTFLGLTDTPDTYTGSELQGVRVNAAGTALEFATAASTLDELTDVTITAAATGDYLRYNGSAWVDVAVSQLVSDLDSSFLTPAEGNAAYQPLDADLTSWAGVTRASGFDTFTATPTSANLGSLVSDDLFLLSDIELGALAGLTSAADKLPYFTGSGTAALADLSSNMRTFMTTPTSANFATLVSDDAFSLADAELGAIAGLTSAADKGIYFTGSGTAATYDLSAYGRTLGGLADETALEALLDTLPNLTSIQSLTVTLADAGANAFFGWDDTAGAYENLTAAEAEAIIEPLIDTLANLTSIQGVSFTFGAYAATLLNNTDEAAFKAAVNLEIGVDVQAHDADLASWAGVTRAAGFDTFAATPSLANLGSLLTDEAAGLITFMTTPSSANLASLVTDDLFQLDNAVLNDIRQRWTAASASGAASLAFYEDTDNGTNRVLLQGAASTADVTLTLQATTGTIYSTGGTDVSLADGGTGASLADPGADRILWWDESDNALELGDMLALATEGSPASGDFLLMVDAAGVLAKVDWASLPGSSSLPADPNDDRILVWDDSDGAAQWADFGLGLAMNTSDVIGLGNGTTLLTDPGADRILFWDDSASGAEVAWLTVGNGLTITTTTIAADSASDTVDGVVELADATEMEAGTATDRAVTPALQHRHPSAAKFWVYWTANSTTILASYNMTSIADTNLGDADGTIATDFSDANWAGFVDINDATAAWDTNHIAAAGFNARAAGTFGVLTTNLEETSGDFLVIDLEDPQQWQVVGFGDQ